MIARWQTETPTDGVWKFVRVKGQYRWLDGMCNHSDAINVAAGSEEVAEAAGTVFIFSDQKLAKKESSWSSTLKIGMDDRAYEDVAKMFNDIGYRWEEY